LSREAEPNEELEARWSALLWLLQKLDGLNKHFPALSSISANSSAQNRAAIVKSCDELAKQASASDWTDEMSRKALKALAATSSDFQQPVAGRSQARRAERLVLAVDRLLVTRKNFQDAGSADAQSNRLFSQAQSIPDFDAPQFAAALKKFSQHLD